jgi:hypothetical protein
MSKDNIIEFAEVEYRPQGLGTTDEAKIQWARRLHKRQNPGVASLPEGSEEVELEQLPTRQTKNVLSKAPGMQVMGRVHERSDNFGDGTRVRATAFV